jgi:arsenate reductase
LDCVFTVCDIAKVSCPIWPGKPILAHWSSPDPAGVEGTDEQKKRAFVDVALQISRRVDLLCALPPGELDQRRVQEIGHAAKFEGESGMRR